MISFAPISGAPNAARDLDYVAAGGATAGASQGLNQSAAAAVVSAVGASHGFSPSAATVVIVVQGASLGLNQGAAARALAYVGASNGLSQSAGAVGSAASSTEAGGSAGLSQSSAAATLIARGGSEGLTQSAGRSTVIAAGASQSVAQVAGTVFTAAPVTTVPEGGGVFRPGRVYVLPHSTDQENRIRISESAEKPKSVVQLKPRPAKQAKETGGDLKALRDRLLDLGRALERNKQAVKDRIRIEQSREDSPELMAILQLLIDEYELTLYNQNAARLLIILADDR